jgi:hypothetical protein
MATIVELATPSGALVKLDIGLDDDQQEFREIYISQKLAGQFVNVLPAMPSKHDLKEQSPQQQVDARTAQFVAGEPLAFDTHFNVLRSHGQGVWELKTADVRIFGWFARKDCFIGVVMADATFVKTHDLYRGFIGEVVRFRNELNLDEPKFLRGEHPNDVVSNWTFTP